MSTPSTWTLRKLAESMLEDFECVMACEDSDPETCKCCGDDCWKCAAAQALANDAAPIPMVLHCPECRTRHVDVGEFETKVHHTHSCQGCGLTWRPAVVPTVGVQFLPGFKNEVAEAPVAPAPTAWRVGRKLGRTLYVGEGLVGIMDTPALAASVVAAMNEAPSPVLPTYVVDTGWEDNTCSYCGLTGRHLLTCRRAADAISRLMCGCPFPRDKCPHCDRACDACDFHGRDARR